MSTLIQKLLRRFAAPCVAAAISAPAMISPTHDAPGVKVSQDTAVSSAEITGMPKTKKGGGGEGSVASVVKIKGDGGDYNEGAKTEVKIGIQDVSKRAAGEITQRAQVSNIKVKGATATIGQQKVGY